MSLRPPGVLIESTLNARVTIFTLYNSRTTLRIIVTTVSGHQRLRDGFLVLVYVPEVTFDGFSICKVDGLLVGMAMRVASAAAESDQSVSVLTVRSNSVLTQSIVKRFD